MPFGMSNALSTLMRTMMHMLRSLIGKCVVVYFDDILVYNHSKETHLQDLRAVLEILRHEKMYAHPKKCYFLTDTMSFLGFIVTAEGVKADPSKVQAIVDWPTPHTITKTRNFLRLASFYKRFIRNFSSIMAPVSDCLMGRSFKWSEVANNAFQLMKKKITQAPVLALPDFDKVFKVDCDASAAGIGAVLRQEGRPIVFIVINLMV